MAYTEEENICMLELYELSKKTPKVAVGLFKEKFGYEPHETTIKGRWKNAGFILQDRGGLRHGFDRKSFIEFYHEHGGDIKSMIKKTYHKRGSLRKLCLKHGLERPK